MMTSEVMLLATKPIVNNTNVQMSITWIKNEDSTGIKCGSFRVKLGKKGISGWTELHMFSENSFIEMSLSSNIF